MNLPLMMTSKNVDISKPVTYKPKNSIIQDLIDFIVPVLDPIVTVVWDMLQYCKVDANAWLADGEYTM